MLLFLLAASALSTGALAAPNYEAERDPKAPEAKKQYRLLLRTPGRACSTWHKVAPKLEKADMLLSDSRKDEKSGCRFLWVITPAQAVGPTTFELEGFTGGKETFELSAPAGYQPPKTADSGPSVSSNIPGIANQDGNGLATGATGKVKLPGMSLDPGTGK